jgi:hypothetical protein
VFQERFPSITGAVKLQPKEIQVHTQNIFHILEIFWKQYLIEIGKHLKKKNNKNQNKNK